jgi:hypothetical protein
LQFYHALAYETSGSPGELLQFKIKDINPQLDESGTKLCALIEIGRYGKKQTPRIAPMTELPLQYYEVERELLEFKMERQERLKDQ